MNLTLTIDMELQKKVEESIREKFKSFKGSNHCWTVHSL